MKINPLSVALITLFIIMTAVIGYQNDKLKDRSEKDVSENIDNSELEFQQRFFPPEDVPDRDSYIESDLPSGVDGEVSGVFDMEDMGDLVETSLEDKIVGEWELTNGWMSDFITFKIDGTVIGAFFYGTDRNFRWEVVDDSQGTIQVIDDELNRTVECRLNPSNRLLVDGKYSYYKMQS